MKLCEEQFLKIEKIKEQNSQKVLKAFIDCKISESHFAATTGYGYNDRGREKLDELFANIFRSEDAITGHGFLSGTHALSTALFGVLRPCDKVLSVTGIPYDTLNDVINGNNLGSLKDFDITFEYVDYSEDNNLYFKSIKEKLKEKFKAIYIQRSKGYSLRSSLSCEKIEKIISFVKSIDKDLIVIVDNCYGEFVETKEPSEVGADITIGSLIKNPGGAIAYSGGYIVGRKDLIRLCANRFSAPGIGKEIGASLIGNRDIFMGIYNAPQVVGEALKTAIFTAAAFEILNFKVYPKYNEERFDTVQSIILEREKELILFCRAIQERSPIDSFVVPEPWDMPGYDSKVIMASGSFISGSSIELSADAPIKEPFAVWFQGGTCFYTAKVAIMNALEKIMAENI